jgi:hypothetical protein
MPRSFASGIIRRVPPGNASSTPPDEPAHDVLAAEAFAVPAADPDLSHRPVVLPEDPSGIDAPHDILAAEEFAMPAVTPHSERGGRGARARRGLLLASAAAAFAAVISVLRGRRRR